MNRHLFSGSKTNRDRRDEAFEKAQKKISAEIKKIPKEEIQAFEEQIRQMLLAKEVTK